MLEGRIAKTDKIKQGIANDKHLQKWIGKASDKLGEYSPRIGGGYPLALLYDFEPNDIDIFIDVPIVGNRAPWDLREIEGIAKDLFGEDYQVLGGGTAYQNFGTTGVFQHFDNDREVQLIINMQAHFDLQVCEVYIDCNNGEVHGEGLYHNAVSSRRLFLTTNTAHRAMKYAYRGLPIDSDWLGKIMGFDIDSRKVGSIIDKERPYAVDFLLLATEYNNSARLNAFEADTPIVAAHMKLARERLHRARTVKSEKNRCSIRTTPCI